MLGPLKTLETIRVNFYFLYEDIHEMKRLFHIFPIIENHTMLFYLARKYNFHFHSFSFRFTKDQTLRSPFPTFSQMHIITSRSALDANIRILLGYKRSGDNIVPRLFSQLIGNSQGLAKAVE